MGRTERAAAGAWGEAAGRDDGDHLAWVARLWPLRRVAPYRAFARKVLSAPVPAAGALGERCAGVRSGLLRTPRDADLVRESFVLACAGSEHALGLRPYATQVMAARVMLDGRLAQLATGEGKTLAIGLAAAAAALASTPVHVITANDYLAERDARQLRGFYSSLGVSAGVVTQPMDQGARRVAYRSDVVYCTGKELAFDYLRDGMLQPADLSPLEMRAQRLTSLAGLTEPVLRGLHMALIDEADTVLIDEARMPLVLSRSGAQPGGAVFLAQALALARTLQEGADFKRQAAQAAVSLTPAGEEKLQRWPVAADALHGNRRHREQIIGLALVALHLLERDRDYVVRDGGVTLIDETTGRAAPGRAWSRGLHQLVELKEGCQASERSATMTQITFQQFFPRYKRCGGMSGTLEGSTGELARVYGLPTVMIPRRQPSIVRNEGLSLFPDNSSLWQAVAGRAAAIRTTGRPVLIGTGSVGDSESLSAALAAAGLPHRILNAKQDRAESEVIAMAGTAGCVTVSTSMAGRGTDIRLGADVAALGGLHVILCQHNASRRIDRQFLGRCARHGEPGSSETLLSLAFPLFSKWLPPWWLRLAALSGFPWPLAPLTAQTPQWLEGYIQRKQRELLCRVTREEERELMFSRRTFQ